MAANEALVKNQVAETAAIVLEMESIVKTTKKDIDDFRFTYEVDTKSQLEANANISRFVYMYVHAYVCYSGVPD